MNHAHTPQPAGFDELDPHASGHGHSHGHHIISGFTLRAILIILLLLTILTVGQAQLEQYISTAFELNLPRWVNIAVVMAIAVVKGCLVALFFMGLKYDNPMNSVILCFTLFGVGLFLGFSMSDLASRGMIYEFKKGEILKGGLGNISRTMNGEPDPVPANTGIVAHARQKKMEEIGPEAYEKLAAQFAHGGHDATHQYPPGSTASRSRPRTGLTEGLFETANPASAKPTPESHGGGH
ncbi:MAG: cytochrome C oxidase subunit IV family protein [Phycisphaerales bacterium]|nr:cytochrome C oxidase subunit IV family protein [Phycisphaerales bacterium]